MFHRVQYNMVIAAAQWLDARFRMRRKKKTVIKPR